MRHERPDGADGAVRADGTVGPVRLLVPRRLGGGRRERRATAAGSSCTPPTTASRSRCSSSTSATSDDALEVPSEELGARRYDTATQLPPDVRAARTYVFDGGCVTVDYALDDAADASLLVELDRALSFQPRSELVEYVDDRTGLILCGAGAPECIGGDR